MNYIYRYFLKTSSKAFTLAEVLLTLVLVGIVSALTIPPLMTNVQDSQFQTALKTNYSVVSQASSLAMNANSGSFVGIPLYHDPLVDLYQPYLNITKRCTAWTSYGEGNCWVGANEMKKLDGSAFIESWPDQAGLILNNGAYLIFGHSSAECTLDNSVYLAFGYYPEASVCGQIWLDVNGNKAPNTWGRDIYGFWVLDNGIKPFGSNGDTFEGTCTDSGSGYGCAGKYLKQ